MGVAFSNRIVFFNEIFSYEISYKCSLFYSAPLIRHTLRNFKINLCDMNRRLILLFAFIRGVLVLHQKVLQNCVV